MSSSALLAPHLPYLRRYARALTGSQGVGDAYVRAALSAILTGEYSISEGPSPRAALYRIFQAIWSSASERYDASYFSPFAASGDPRLGSLDPAVRAALLLTAVETFSADDAAYILGEEIEDVERAVAEAELAFGDVQGARILIIEDEPLISLDLESLATELGHEVVGIAATHRDAVEKARSALPQLILADINLGEGGSGLEAVTEILQSFNVPVIFITAYPERLLTGERPEPTYLIAKPFLADSVRATIEQVLFFHLERREAA